MQKQATNRWSSDPFHSSLHQVLRTLFKNIFQLANSSRFGNVSLANFENGSISLNHFVYKQGYSHFLNHGITPFGFRAWGVPGTRLFFISRLLDFGPGGHTSHASRPHGYFFPALENQKCKSKCKNSKIRCLVPKDFRPPSGTNIFSTLRKSGTHRFLAVWNHWIFSFEWDQWIFAFVRN